MTKTLTLAASALALAASGVAFAQQDAYTPPVEDKTTTTEETTLPEGEDDTLYGEDAYAEPQGDANDDEGEVLEADDDLDDDTSYDDGAEAPYGEDAEVLPEADPEL